MCSYYFPPIHSIGVVRNAALANKFLDHFKKVFVISQQVNQGSDKSGVVASPSIQVNRVRKWDYRDLNRSKETKGQIHFNTVQKKGWLKKVAIKSVNTIPINYFFGEGGSGYIHRAYYEAVKLIQKNNIQYIFSSFRPYADHFVAWKLKKKFPNLIWIADFRDLHVDDLYQLTFLPKWQSRLTRKILSRANLVTTVSEGLALTLRKLHDNVEVLHNPVQVRKEFSTKEKFEKFTFCYTGSLVDGERNPGKILEAIKNISGRDDAFKMEINIIYAGNHGREFRSNIIQHSLEESYHDLGLISRQDSLIIQDRSHINILMTSSIESMPGILTGKFLEYLGGWNPVLTLIKGMQDPIFDQLYEEYEIGGLFYNSGEVHLIEEYILHLYDLWKGKKSLISLEKRRRVQSYFSWDQRVLEVIGKAG